MGRYKSLSLAHRFESPHATLSYSSLFMRLFNSIVGIYDLAGLIDCPPQIVLLASKLNTPPANCLSTDGDSSLS